MDSLARLTSALSDRYTLDRELGQGGMAVVYLAQDRKLDRPVALKVLRPELAASLGADRFLREIQIASKLSHPNILGLHDCGEADGLLYYTMPYVEGETLRDRMNREKQLPLEDALQITREVAGALGHAHEQGLVHRDVKPENILFQGGHAVVADFGIARALSEAGTATLTETGLAVGTPAYMSPEQAAGSSDVDGRADLYSLGCVLYEMLSGDAPYMASTPMAVIAKKLSEPVPHISVVREAVPGSVEAALTKALARNAADRFKTAEQFTAALAVDTAAFERKQKVRRRVRRMAMGAAALVVLAAAGIGLARYRAATDWKRVELDPNLIAVMPFQVTSADPEIAMLDQGLPAMVFHALSGATDLRAVEPSSLLRRWTELEARGETLAEDAPLRLAAQSGAGRVLTGSVTHAGSELTVVATSRRVPTGQEIAPHSFSIPVDSLNDLPVRLVLGVLGAELGERRDQLAHLSHHPPEAWWAFLAGAKALRNLDYPSAVRQFEAALDADSSFALAALRQSQIPRLVRETYGEYAGRRNSAVRHAIQHQENLGRQEQAALSFRRLVNRIDTLATYSDMVSAARDWTEAFPDDPDPEAWLAYARLMMQGGRLIAIPGWKEELRSAFEGAWQVDSVTLPLIEQHLLVSSYSDPEWFLRVAPNYLAVADTASRDFVGYAWFHAFLRGDSSTVQAFRTRASEGDPRYANGRVLSFLIDGVRELGMPLRDADLVRTLAVERSVSPEDSAEVHAALAGSALHWGRLREFGDLSLKQPGNHRGPIDLSVVYPQLDGLAAIAADSLRQFVSENPGANGPRSSLLLYRAAQGDTIGVRDSARVLADRLQSLNQLGVCAVLAEALVEAQGPIRDDAPALERLDSILRMGSIEYCMNAALVSVPRLRRRRNEFPAALEASRRRMLGVWQSNEAHAALLKEEGSLAAIVGDTARAIEAYREFLRLWARPDDLGQPTVDSVRAALTALEAVWSGHD